MWSCLLYQNLSHAALPAPCASHQWWLGTLCHSFQIMHTGFYLLLEVILVINLLQYCHNTLNQGVQHTDLDSVLKRGLDKGFEYNKSILRGSQTKSDPPEPRDSLSSSALLPPAAERSQNLFAKGAFTIPAPSEVNLEHLSISAVRVYWEYPFDQIPSPIQFIVQCSKDGGPYKNVSNLLNETSFVYNNLWLGAYYQFRVVAYHNGEASPPSEESYFFINGETAPPGPPTNVVAMVRSNREIELLWDQPSPSFSAASLIYKIYWGEDPDNLVKEDFVQGETHKAFVNLSPGTTYYFALRADLSSHVSSLSAVVSATTLLANLPALAIVSSKVSTHWVWLEWSDPPPNRYPLIVDKFVVYYAKQSDLSSPTALADLSQFWNQTVESKKRNGNVTDLTPATEYVFRVVYVAGKFTSDLSGPKTIATLDGVVCDSCQPVSTTELRITWMSFSSGSKPRSFEIFESLPGNQLQRIAGVNTTESEAQYIVDGLHPWSGHTFVVALGNGSRPDQSDQCPTLECWTFEAPPSKPPTSLTAVPVSPTAVVLEWDLPPPDSQNGIIVDYILVYECTPREAWQLCNTMQVVVPVTADSPSYKAESLLPFSSYLFEVAAETSAGRSQFSPPVFLTTPEDVPSAPPANVTVQNTTDHSVFLSWDSPAPWNQNGIITNYTVYYAETQCQELSPDVSVLGGQTTEQVVHKAEDSAKNFSISGFEVEIGGLRASTCYSVAVAASTGAGQGPMSRPLIAMTLISVIYSTADLNFTADVNASAAHSHYCFSIRFSWTLIFNPKDDSHSLPFQLTNDTAVIAVNLSLQYLPESQSDQNRNRTVAVSDATATEIELHSSKDLLPATRYLFWLVVAAELSNGTYERLRSLTTIDLVTPLCNGDDVSGRRARVIAVAVPSAIVSTAACVCTVACCLWRWQRKGRARRPGHVAIEEQPPEMENSEYVSLDLRRSDGRSISSSEIEEDDSMTQSLSRFPSEHDSSDGSSISFDERSPFLEDYIESGNNDSFLSNVERNRGRVEFPSDIPTEPRPSPDGCSISSSSSDSCLLPDVLD